MSRSPGSVDDPHAGQPVLTAGAPLASADQVMLLVHGRGGSAEGILDLGRALVRGPASEATALLAPQAAGRSWYPESFMAPIARNEPWLSSALARLTGRVEEVLDAGIPLEAVVLAGFSQGACLASEFVARNPARYRALLAFTGGLIGPPLMAFDHAGDLAGMPVYLSSGDTDPYVPWRRVEATREVFERMGGRVTLRRWPGRPHTILSEEIGQARRLVSETADA